MASTVQYATLAQVKASMGKTLTAQDTSIELALDGACRAIDRYCGREEDGFVAGSSAVARLFKGTGGAHMRIPECIEITLVEVKDSPTDTAYESWASTDWIAARGSLQRPDFNRLPYTMLIVDPNGDQSNFTSGDYRGLQGFKPEINRVRGLPTVRLTAKWGYAEICPSGIKMAAIMQTVRWFKRLEGAMADTVGGGEFGMMMYTRDIDPDIKLILTKGRFKRPVIG